MLSRSSWSAVLKTLEEPPSHLYMALCTTEYQKVPETVVTRCYHLALRVLRDNEVADLLEAVVDLEGWQVAPSVMQVVIQAATGQPRKALSLLQSCYDAPSAEEAKRIVHLLDTSEPVIELIKYLMAGKRGWEPVRKFLSQIDDESFAEAMIPAGRYIIGAMVREESDKNARVMWQVLEAMLFPSASFDPRAQFISAIGRVLWAE